MYHYIIEQVLSATIVCLLHQQLQPLKPTLKQGDMGEKEVLKQPVSLVIILVYCFKQNAKSQLASLLSCRGGNLENMTGLLLSSIESDFTSVFKGNIAKIMQYKQLIVNFGLHFQKLSQNIQQIGTAHYKLNLFINCKLHKKRKFRGMKHNGTSIYLLWYDIMLTLSSTKAL